MNSANKYSFSSLFLLLALSGLYYSCSPKKKKETPKDKANIIGYYYLDSENKVSDYPVDKLSHIIFSFLYLRGNELAFAHPEDAVELKEVVKLKKTYPALKVLISLGGWGGCKTCSEVFSTEKGRRDFSESVEKILEATHTDGIDLDWEYPAIQGEVGHRFAAEDKHNFTLLVESLRNTLGEEYEISFAAGGYTEYLEKSIEWSAVMPLVNRVHLMSYDLVNGNSTVSGHHTPLYSTPQQLESTDHAVRFLDSIGVPSHKIIIGAGFYARIFDQVANINHGLYQPGHFKKSIDYRLLSDSLSSERGFVEYWDTVAKAPYAYNAGSKEFATFDNEQSIALKTTYAKNHKLGGIMFWAINGDKKTKGLVDVMHRLSSNKK